MGMFKKRSCLLGVSSRFSVRQLLQTHSQPREAQNYIWVGQKLSSRKWPNVNQQFWDSVFGSFKPIHPKHKDDKPLTWVATIRSDVPPKFMEQFRAMISLHTDGFIAIAVERENKQSKSEEQFWKWLKNRSKTTFYRRDDCMMVGSIRSRGRPRTWR